MTTAVFNKNVGGGENKKLDVSGLAKKTNYSAKISGVEAIYFTTSDYNKITNKILKMKMKEVN